MRAKNILNVVGPGHGGCRESNFKLRIAMTIEFHRRELVKKAERKPVIQKREIAVQAKHILIAVGARAWRLPIEGSELTLTSDEILDLEKLPKKLAIIGSGYIALEFASIYNNYGADVHVFFRQVGPVPSLHFASKVNGDPEGSMQLPFKARVEEAGDDQFSSS